MKDHDCDGCCTSCFRTTCEFCGEVDSEGNIYCHECDLIDDDFEDDDEQN